MLTFYGAGKKAAHAAKTVKHGVSDSCYKLIKLTDLCTLCTDISVLTNTLKTLDTYLSLT